LINRRENNKMSKFSAFMKANKKVKENEKFAPTASLLGSDGTPVRWEFISVPRRMKNFVMQTPLKFR
jgi:hypothetical protein